MNTTQIWKDYFAGILEEVIQAHSQLKFAEQSETTPNTKRAIARHSATIDAHKASADSLWSAIQPKGQPIGSDAIDAMLEISDRLAAEDGTLKIWDAAESAHAEYFNGK